MPEGPELWLSPRFLSCVDKLSKSDVARVERALSIIPECFGRPHSHQGISIRRLRQNLFECRAGLKLRLLFREHRGRLEFFFVGTHDAIQRLIRDYTKND